MDNKKKFYECEIAISHQIKKDVNTENFLRTSQKSTKIKSNESNRLKNFGNFAPGRGFGNLYNNNSMRFGENSRHDTKQFSKDLESNANFRFDFLFDNKKQKAFTESTLKINENTRKQQVRSESIFDYKKFDFNEKQRLENEYFNTINTNQKSVKSEKKSKSKSKSKIKSKIKSKSPDFNFNY